MIAEVSKRFYSSKAKNSNVRYFALPISTVNREVMDKNSNIFKTGCSYIRGGKSGVSGRTRLRPGTLAHTRAYRKRAREVVWEECVP